MTTKAWVAELHKWFTPEPKKTKLYFFLKRYAANFTSDIHQACKSHRIDDISLIGIKAPIDLYTLAFYSEELQRAGSFTLTELGRTREAWDWEISFVHYANYSNMLNTSLPFMIFRLNEEEIFLPNLTPKLQNIDG